MLSGIGSRASTLAAIAAVNNVVCAPSTPTSNTKSVFPTNFPSILNVCGSQVPFIISFQDSIELYFENIGTLNVTPATVICFFNTAP